MRIDITQELQCAWLLGQRMDQAKDIDPVNEEDGSRTVAYTVCAHDEIPVGLRVGDNIYGTIDNNHLLTDISHGS